MKLVKQTIPIQKLPSGDVLSIKTYAFKGNGKKKIYIQANIHGPELTGILVVKKFIDYFKKHEGNFAKMVLVPSCNPIGLNSQFIGQLTGYVNHLTGKNWNRIYVDLSKNIKLPIKESVSFSKFNKLLLKNLEAELSSAESIESKLALTLQKLSFDADIVIDLHSAWGRAPHYIYCYPNQIEEAKSFGVNSIILLDPTEFLGVFDEASMYPYFKSQKKIKGFKFPKQVFTFELGSDCSLEKGNIELGFQEIESYLLSQGVLKTKQASVKQSEFDVCLSKDFQYCHAPTGGLLIWNKKPGEYFKKGEIIAEIHSLDTESVIPVKASHKGKLIIQFNARSVHQGQQICKVILNFKKIKERK